MNKYVCNKYNNRIALIIMFFSMFITSNSIVVWIYSCMDRVDIYQLIILIIEIVVIYYLSIAFHEFGHLIMYKYYKYKLKIIVIGPIIITFDKIMKLRLKVSPLILGGVIQCNINNCIRDYKTLKEFTDNLKRILYGGVIASIILIILSILLIQNSLFSQIGKIILLINVYSVLGAGFYFGNTIGDLKLISILKKDYKDILLELYGNIQMEFPVTKELRNLIEEYCVSRLKDGNFDYKLLENIVIIIQYNIIFNEDLSNEILKFIRWFENSLEYLLDNGSVIEKNIYIRFYNKIERLGLISQKKDLSKYKYVKDQNYNDIFFEEFEEYRNMKLFIEK